MFDTQLPATIAPTGAEATSDGNTDLVPRPSDAEVLYGKHSAGDRAREGERTEAALVSYRLELPQGTFVDKPLLTEFTKWARESNFTNQQAQRAADLHLKSLAAYNRQLLEESQAQVKAWGDEVRNSELGGSNMAETIADAEKLFTIAATVPGLNVARLKADLVRTGMANHPDLIRLARHIGLNFAE